MQAKGLPKSMENRYKPTGYNSLAPCLVVESAERMIELLKDIFNTDLQRRYDMLDGSLMHAEPLIVDSILMTI